MRNDDRSGDKRARQGNGGERRSYGDKRSYGSDERRGYGDKRAYGSDERRGYGEKRTYGSDERRSYGDKRAYGSEEHNGYGRKTSGGDRPSYERKPYGQNRFDGPARRTYGEDRGRRFDGPGPRVGRIADDVPHAQRVTGEREFRAPARESIMNAEGGKRGGGLHRGNAWRSESGPKGRERNYAAEYEAPEIPESLVAEFTDVPMDDEHLLVGRNPIREALKAGRPMEKLLVASGDLSGAAREILQMARDAGVVVQQVERSRLDRIYPAHQGMLAYVAAVPYTDLHDMIAAAKASGDDAFLVVLDGVTDPHNLGAIIRSAECAGAHGVIVPERRAAGLSPAAAKAAAGALNHMPVSRVKNLNRAIELLKEEGIWVIGTAMEGEDAFEADLTGPIALVIGSEGDGVSRLALQKCDRTVSLPMTGHIESLNASVAAGILMYEVVRQRRR